MWVYIHKLSRIDAIRKVFLVNKYLLFWQRGRATSLDLIRGEPLVKSITAVSYTNYYLYRTVTVIYWFNLRVYSVNMVVCILETYTVTGNGLADYIQSRLFNPYKALVS